MTEHSPKRSQVRPGRRFQPSDGTGKSDLETRELMSHTAPSAVIAHHAHPVRVPPAAEINAVYDAFRKDFADVEQAYIQVPSTSQTNAAGIFPSFIVNRTNQMAIDLVQYFNGLPLKLPKFNNPPHTPINRGAIQNYVYNSVAGGESMSLQQSLLAIPLPTTAGSDLQIYNAAMQAAVAQSRTLTLNGVSQIYAGRLLISTPAPNNRFGVIAPKTIPDYILGTSTTSTG